MTIWMDLMHVLMVAILCLSLVQNLPKLPLMVRCMENPFIAYRICYWQSVSDSVKSKSSPFWLFIHLISAQTLMVVAVADSINQMKEHKIFEFLHYWNVLLILVNCWNFVGFVYWKAMLINVTAVLILLLTHYYEWKLTYFFILSTPIFLEDYKRSQSDSTSRF